MDFQYQENVCLGFSLVPGIGPLRYQLLLKRFSSPLQSFNAHRKDLAEVLGDTTADRLVRFRESFDANRFLSEYEKSNITIITQYSPQFPRLLLQIQDPPICLFALHKDNKPLINDDSVHIAVVGSRNYSTYGKSVTYSIVSELAEAGMTIVSGLALGIDAIAHQAALDAGGKTVAVLGCGVDVVYPPHNHVLRKQIIDSGNTLISEFAPGTQPSRGSFVVRNRIVSGMSRGVLITEGTDRSGSLITATNAAEQGRDVFAIPGSITSPTAQAPHILLKQGAKLVTSAADILTEYSLQNEKTRKKVELNLSDDARAVYSLLSSGAEFADEIAMQLKWSIIQVMSVLSVLEIEGVVTKDNEGKYAISSL